MSTGFVEPNDCDTNGYCLDCGSATIHKTECVCTTRCSGCGHPEYFHEPDSCDYDTYVGPCACRGYGSVEGNTNA